MMTRDEIYSSAVRGSTTFSSDDPNFQILRNSAVIPEVQAQIPSEWKHLTHIESFDGLRDQIFQDTSFTGIFPLTAEAMRRSIVAAFVVTHSDYANQNDGRPGVLYSLLYVLDQAKFGSNALVMLLGRQPVPAAKLSKNPLLKNANFEGLARFYSKTHNGLTTVDRSVPAGLWHLDRIASLSSLAAPGASFPYFDEESGRPMPEGPSPDVLFEVYDSGTDDKFFISSQGSAADHPWLLDDGTLSRREKTLYSELDEWMSTFVTGVIQADMWY